MENTRTRVIMLCDRGRSSRIVYNALAKHVDVVRVVIEKDPSRYELIRKRWKKLGPLKTSGQLMFILMNTLFNVWSRGKKRKLMVKYQLDDSPFPEEITEKVDNVNCDGLMDLLQEVSPDAIVVNGTRIISKKVLSSVSIPFINTHMGITPKYRGVHGGYWALVNKDPENCGVTIHLVDPGIDTGGVLYRDRIIVDPSDNFNTYPVHQIAVALPLLLAALDDIKGNRIRTVEGVLPSCLRYHPTLLEYVKHWIRDGVR